MTATATDRRATRARVCTVIHSPGAMPDLSGARSASPRGADDASAWTRAAHGAAVVIADAAMLASGRDLAALPAHVVVVAADAATAAALGRRVDIDLGTVTDVSARQLLLINACRLSSARVAAWRRKRLLVCLRRDLSELNDISINLMNERDQEALLDQIVKQGRTLTRSDGGCLFMLERDTDNVPHLRPKVFTADSLPNVGAMTLGRQPAVPLSRDTIIGYAATVLHHVVVDDAYHPPPKAPYASMVDFETRFGYHVKSLLAVPMVDHNDRLLGILAFVNRKRDRTATIRDKESADRHVVAYTRHEVRLARALAGVAAASIENSMLHARVEQILEGVVKACVSAIDERDPSTAGHSLRVATLTTGLARAVEQYGKGRYRGSYFTREQMRELHFAALLHDLGKVAVPEALLTKAKKLPAELQERIRARFDFIKRTIEANHYRTCRVNGSQLDPGCAAQFAEVERFWVTIRAANEPGSRVSQHDLEAIARNTFLGPDGTPMHYLAPEEVGFLAITYGTLDGPERDEIESHVEQTYRFLSQIPWTEDLKNLPGITRGHHEMLDGSGYPRGLEGDEIPVQARLMTIADIFDALTAADRPYRHAMKPEQALAILQGQAKAGLLDGELLQVMIDSQVYRQILR